MGNFTTPTMYDFSVFDANKIYYITFSSNGSTDIFNSYTTTITNIDNDTVQQYTDSISMISVDIDNYISGEYINYKNLQMVYYNGFYYLIIPPNYLVNGQRYSLYISFADNNNNETYPVGLYSFECYSKPVIKLESYKYNDGKNIFVGEDINEITVMKPVCFLNFSYTQDDGDALKYYYFELYNNDNKLLGRSHKIYSSSKIKYALENYNNLQTYKLTLYCETQSGVLENVTYTFNTDYTKDSVYADISFFIDKESALNNISINVTQLNGNGENYSFDSTSEYVTIQDNGYVGFVDTYKTISKNFLCRMWCRNLTNNMLILKIEKTDGSGYIDVFFTGQKFVAYKYSFGLVSSYISNYLVESGTISKNQDVYFSIGYYDGRIEMYTSLLD